MMCGLILSIKPPVFLKKAGGFFGVQYRSTQYGHDCCDNREQATKTSDGGDMNEIVRSHQE